MRSKHFWIISLFFVFICSCSGHYLLAEEENNEQQQGVFPADTWYSEKDYDDQYLEKVQPILSKRCVTCHGCYEAPCQLNLQSYQGVRRGYNAIPVYSMQRLKSTPITWMNDVYPLSAWRELEFLPVVANDEEDNDADKAENWALSLLRAFIEEGNTYNEPDFLLSEKLKTVNNNFKDKNQVQCTATTKQFKKHFKKNPWEVVTFDDYLYNISVNGIASGAGMPFGLPALNKDERAILNTWMENGAKGPSEKTMKQLQTPKNPEAIERWEKFLNTDSAQGRQAARYIYEHTYTAYLHFDENPGEYFSIVRMAKMADNAEGEIISKFPYQLPQGVSEFSYRLKKVTEAIVQKKMIVWRVNDKRLARLEELFLGNWQNNSIPEPQYDSSNPFAYFAAIPAKIRARFLIENADAVVGALVQSAVCIGSGATYAIRDHFWVWFLDPDSDISVIKPMLGLSSWDELSTGRDEQQMSDKKYTGTLGSLWNKIRGFKHDVKTAKEAWAYYRRTSKDDKLYLKAYERQLRIWLKSQNRKGLKATDLWDGYGDSAYGDSANPNAWLNVTRHGRSTTVQRGPEGGEPGSIWVLSFSNLERVYYNLVVNYSVYGNLAMKIGTFRIMTYNRLEAEDLAISFLPTEARDTMRLEYTKGIGWIILKEALYPQWSMEELDSDDGKLPARPAGTPRLTELYERFKRKNRKQGKNEKDAAVAAAYTVTESLIRKAKRRLREVSRMNYNPDAVSGNQKSWEDKIRNTVMHKSKKEDGVEYPEYFPSICYLKINSTQGEPWVYSLIVDRAYKSHDVVGTASFTRDPEGDLLTLYRGFVGAYPNVFLEINEGQPFISDIKQIKSKDHWRKFVGKYGISRNSAGFWPFFDWIHSYQATSHPGVDPVMQGIVDVGQYDFFYTLRKSEQ